MGDFVPIDSPNHEAFAHWVFESAIFLPDIRAQGKRVGVAAKKDYKRLFCKHFGFTEEDIEYTSAPRGSTLTLMDAPVPPEYPERLRTFFTQFSSTVVPDVDFVLLPRQTKENYVNNNRPCKLTPYLHVFETSGRTYRIVNTDDITNLQTQIDLVNSGRTVIVTDGSPAIVNGMFCSGKKIYVVREPTLEQQVLRFPMMQLIQTEIQKKNTMHFIDASQLFTLVPT
jgi:hypothetical protein